MKTNDTNKLELNEERPLPGMTWDETETFVIEQQGLAHQLRDAWETARVLTEGKRAELKKAESDERYKRGKLLAVLRFLSLYNPEAHEDWFAEFGLTPEGDLLQ